MIKFKRASGVFFVLLLSFVFTGCEVRNDKESKDKTEVTRESMAPETSKEPIQESTESVSMTEQPTATTDPNKEILKRILTIENGIKDIDTVFRNPDSYKGKEFTFSGQVVKSETMDNGIQQIVIGLYTSAEMLKVDNVEFEKFIKVNCDIAGFGGTRLVQGDGVGIIVTFKEIVNDAQYGGDTLLFEAQGYLDLLSYWSVKCIDKYYASLNVDVSNMNLKQIDFLTQKEFEEILGSEVYGDFDYSASRIFTVNESGYLLVYYVDTFEEIDENGIELFSGKRDEKGVVISTPVKEFFAWEFIDNGE